MNELFEIAPSLSPRLAWMQKHQVRTHHNPNGDIDEGWEPWSAWLPANDWSATHSGCYDPEHESCVGFGKTEEDAIIEMAIRNNLPLWNQ